MSTLANVLDRLEELTGQRIPCRDNTHKIKYNPFDKGGIGYSQFNELLLTLGYDRVKESFFYYVFNNVAIQTYEDLSLGITKFRKHAILLYGNVKYAFKKLTSLDKVDLDEALRPVMPRPISDYRNRHGTLHRISVIPPEDTYYLGYIVEQQLKDQIKRKPKNKGLKRDIERLGNIQKLGKQNHDTYLTYDHMDVYVATSMRDKHEFWVVRDFIKNLFSRPDLQELKLRWFDPTQAYCPDRIDKGLVEALMVKRAKCTIYHVQEADTLGKDSELAATLAQGKPVIAFIPNLTDREDFIRLIRIAASKLYKEYSYKQLLLEKFFPLFYPEGAWKDKKIQGWLTGKIRFNENEASELFFEKAKEMYDKRANNLQHKHPLGLQVNLATGVANGVLVVRSISDCARLLRSIMLNEMEFDLAPSEKNGRVAWHLREKISGCIFRTVTGDDVLTNSFWNFYLRTPPFP